MKDCCDENNLERRKTKMDKKLILWIVIAILALLVIYVVFFKDSGTAGQAIASTTQSSNAMVGGC